MWNVVSSKSYPKPDLKILVVRCSHSVAVLAMQCRRSYVNFYALCFLMCICIASCVVELQCNIGLML
jgi:hypothetical protein